MASSILTDSVFLCALEGVHDDARDAPKEALPEALGTLEQA
jgi:hypothetical protein